MFSSCSSFYKTLTPAKGDPSCLSKFKPAFGADWYDASVDVMSNHISGLILFKTMPDSALHVAFTSKTGLKFFDFEFKQNGDFKVFYIIDQLNKKIIINALRKDFEIIMMRSVKSIDKIFLEQENTWFAAPNSQKGMDYYVTDKDCTRLIKIENAGRKKALEVRFSTFEGGLPLNIHLKHLTFDMEINLTKIDI